MTDDWKIELIGLIRDYLSVNEKREMLKLKIEIRRDVFRALKILLIGIFSEKEDRS